MPLCIPTGQKTNLIECAPKPSRPNETVTVRHRDESSLDLRYDRRPSQLNFHGDQEFFGHRGRQKGRKAPERTSKGVDRSEGNEERRGRDSEEEEDRKSVHWHLVTGLSRVLSTRPGVLSTIENYALIGGRRAAHIEIRPDRQSITPRGARVMYASDPERKSEILPPPPASGFPAAPSPPSPWPGNECLFLLLRSGERHGELQPASDPHPGPRGPWSRRRVGVV